MAFCVQPQPCFSQAGECKLSKQSVAGSGKWYVSTTQEEQASLVRLAEAGKVQRSLTAPEEREWQFTEEGLQTLASAWALSDPRQLCVLNESNALTDRTSYELLLTMRLEGWIWMQWQGSKQCQAALTPGYRPGDEKIWVTRGKATTPYNYMLVLLQAEDSLPRALCWSC